MAHSVTNPTDATYLLILDALPDGIVVFDSGGRIVHANQPALSVFGYKSQPLPGKAAKLFTDLPAPPFSANEVPCTGRRQDGSAVSLAVRLRVWQADSGPMTLAVVRERGKSELGGEELLSRDHLSRILDIAEDGIVTTDARSRVVLFNQGAEKIFGYSAAEALGQSLDLLLPARYASEHARHMAEFARAPDAARRMGERRPVFGRRKDGSEFPAEVSISKLPTRAGMLFTAIVRDITERKRAEEAIRGLNEELEQRVLDRTRELEESNRQLAEKNIKQVRAEEDLRATNRELQRALTELRTKSEELQAMTQQLWQAAKLATLGELAASIAHELNNPLATISLRIEEVLARTLADNPSRRSLEIVEQEVDRMSSLVANLLQFSRRGRHEISTVDVPEELRRALELVDYHLRHRNIEVVREFSCDVPSIYADRQKLRQVFLNLLTNAADAMPRGGVLRLRLVVEACNGDTRAIRIEFCDNGVGIVPEHLERVTEPFFTTKEEGKGTGLGLAICRRVVEEHRGTLQIASAIGKGTTVTVLLPVSNGTNTARLRD